MLTRPVVLFASIAAAVTLVVGAACAQVNEQAIKDVADGKLKEARASWWGFDEEDASQCLQAAINSGVPRLIVDNVGKTWIVTPISLVSDQEILFEEGVEVRAKRGEFKGGGDCLFRADEKKNITLTGYKATFRMWRDDYDAEPYKKAEWRHVLSFKSCENIKVYGLTLAESGGDGIYLGTAKRGVTNKGVHIKDVICDKNYRQGISVITAEDLLIENTIMRDTDGTAPRAGIDFEPNHRDERLVNCVMRNCLSENNSGDGYVLYLPPMQADSEPLSVTFDNCRAVGNASSTRIITGNSPGSAVPGFIEYTNCVFEGGRGGGIVVASKPVNGCRVTFDNCSIIDPAPEQKPLSPIALMSRNQDSYEVGGVELKNITIRDPLDRKPIAYANGGGVGLKNVTGNLILEKGDQRENVPITAEKLAEWIPQTTWRNFARVDISDMAYQPLTLDLEPAELVPAFVRMRINARMVLHAEEGDEVSFKIAYKQLASLGGDKMPVTVTTPSGDECAKAELLFKTEETVTFTAPETGIYRVQAIPGRNYAQFLESSHPMAVNGEDGTVRLLGSVGTLYFWVPEGTEEFAVRVSGEGLGEAIKGAIITPEGTVHEEEDNILATYQFEVELPEPSEGAAWGIRFSRPSDLAMEDHYVDLRGVPAFYAASPNAVFVAEE